MKTTSFLSTVALGENLPVQHQKSAIALSLQNLWEQFRLFMTDKSTAIAPEIAPDAAHLTDEARNDDFAYSQKARFYPYLSEVEEQRDWLEVTFSSPNRHF